MRGCFSLPHADVLIPLSKKQMHMKHINSFLLLALLAIFIPNFSHAQNIPDEGEEIEVTIEEYTSENGPARGLFNVPFKAILFRSLSCIGVEFYNNIGEVIITLTNENTGGCSSFMIDSQCGYCFIPVSNISGLYSIELLVPNEITYRGLFTVF